MIPPGDGRPPPMPEAAPSELRPELRPEIQPELRPSADPFRGHHARDAALVLPLVGLVLFAPPVINLFLADVEILGMPLIGVYLFTVWGLLVACALWLSPRLEAGRPH
ncbi:MAG TPA: hypothetical protein VFN28_07560 [Amaricoccus sp.]|nr:hypothetical protein [Amaricoccus sp.]